MISKSETKATNMFTPPVGSGPSVGWNGDNDNEIIGEGEGKGKVVPGQGYIPGDRAVSFHPVADQPGMRVRRCMG
ncbi:MAG: hypothetical protein Kow0089_22330 [Desulfobulbaceae bacterium]